MIRRAPAMLLLLGSCSLVTDFHPDEYLERTEALCSDAVDNDGNGAADCADSACQQFDFCKESSELSCKDDKDNDLDGKKDCKDPDCCATTACSGAALCGESSSEACADGLDNDSNGLTDCMDFSCTHSRCCQRMVPILAESFTTSNTSCTPPDCNTENETCCIGTLPHCNHFDVQRWIAWGKPAPRIEKGKLSPNQPCSACTVSGIHSVVSAQLSPNLYLEFEANANDLPDVDLGIGLVDKIAIPVPDKQCGGVDSSFPMLLGVKVSGVQIQIEVGGVIRHIVTGKNAGPQKIQIFVENSGAVLFRQNDKTIYASKIKITPPYSRVSVLVQGNSAAATVDNILLARRTGCSSPASWSTGPRGKSPILLPSATSEDFDSSSVSDPSIIFDGDHYRLYYVGTSGKKKGSQLGIAISDDGQTWTRSDAPLTIHGESSPDISSPVVIRHGQSFMMAYKIGAPTEKASIAIATSPDGDIWTRSTLAITQGSGADWDAGGVSAPAVAYYRNQFFLWYAGWSTKTTIPRVGLAVSKDGKTFAKDKNNPILRPSASSQDLRGVTDPWVIRNGAGLAMWFVGLSWGGKNQINYAVSEDGHNWVRFPGNPVIDLGTLFSDIDLRGPTVLDRWGSLQMWYGGVSTAGVRAIGHAVNANAGAPSGS